MGNKYGSGAFGRSCNLNDDCYSKNCKGGKCLNNCDKSSSRQPYSCPEPKNFFKKVAQKVLIQ